MFEFMLFISGQSARSRRIISDLESFLSDELGGQYTLRIVDVIEHPHIAQENGILATPTLLKTSPPPKRILGDLSGKRKVLDQLGLGPRPKPSR
ncbi:MAG: circadian clock protein KaiB [Deltaproteobacteria bacterium]|nr:circadian clock protein KaiB [Deltaproteobacteria bacterium]